MITDERQPQQEPLTLTSENGSQAAPIFWQRPEAARNGLRWHVPALRSQAELSRGDQVMGLVERLASLLKDFPLRMWHLRWNLVTRAGAATAERERLECEARRRLEELQRRAAQARREIEVEIEALIPKRDEAVQQRESLKKEFAEAASTAGLTCAAAVSPHQVEAALQRAAPNLDEVAGERGMEPAAVEAQSTLKQVFAVIAPFVSGFMLALCLGTLVGLLSLADLQRNDRGLQLALAASLGFVLVYLIGELVSGAVHSLARCLENPDSGYPRHRRSVAIVLLLLVGALVLGIAEVNAEAFGLRELHLQRLQELRRLDPEAPITLLPLTVYCLLGTLISGPYLLCKAVRSWGDSELRLREGWLLYLRRRWLEQRSATATVQRAFLLASQVVRVEQTLTELDHRLNELRTRREAHEPQLEYDSETKSRLDAATAAAVGEAARQQAFIDDLIKVLEPHPEVKKPYRRPYWLRWMRRVRRLLRHRREVASGNGSSARGPGQRNRCKSPPNDLPRQGPPDSQSYVPPDGQQSLRRQVEAL
jgi:hypothetical protein